MKLSLEERKVLYAYGCTNHHNTVTRLKWLTALAVDRKSKQKLLILTRKIDHETSENNYQAFYFYIRYQMEGYFKARNHCCFVELTTNYEEEHCLMKLTKYEKETIINYNEGEQEASIYTFNPDLKRMLAEFSQKTPICADWKKVQRRGCNLCDGQISAVHPTGATLQ